MKNLIPFLQSALISWDQFQTVFQFFQQQKFSVITELFFLHEITPWACLFASRTPEKEIILFLCIIVSCCPVPGSKIKGNQQAGQNEKHCRRLILDIIPVIGIHSGKERETKNETHVATQTIHDLSTCIQSQDTYLAIFSSQRFVPEAYGTYICHISTILNFNRV